MLQLHRVTYQKELHFNQYQYCSIRDAMGGAAKRATGGPGAVARPGGRVPHQDAAGGTHLAPHPAAAPPLAPRELADLLADMLANMIAVLARRVRNLTYICSVGEALNLRGESEICKRFHENRYNRLC